MSVWNKTVGLLLALAMIVVLFTGAAAESDQTLPLPAFTQTACEWDEAGRLVRETTTDLNGAPALNRSEEHTSELQSH